MTSYRFRRRAFIAAMSGGVGLKIMLRNLESSARGVPSPGRLLITHWPVGIVAGASDALWKPASGSVVGSVGLKPFADARLGLDMTVIRGLTTSHLASNGGGGSEAGLVKVMTALSPAGVRANRVEADDAIAAGGSLDQILLKNVPALRGRVGWYASSAADARTDFGELASKTLSYSTNMQVVTTFGNGGTVQEAIPIRPALSPLQQFTSIFASFVPGTGAGGSAGGATGAGGAGAASPRVADAMLKKLVAKRSVLDFAAEELNQLKRIAPSAARDKLSIHTNAVLAAESSVVNAISTQYPATGGAGGSTGTGGSGAAGAGGAGGGGPFCDGCTTKPPTPPTGLAGMADPPNGVGNSFGNPVAMQDDGPLLHQVGRAHLDVLRAAFICDLIRVGTFQWAPATNHVGFALSPLAPQPFQHHPMSHRINTADTVASSTVAGLNEAAQFLLNAQLWYFARHAEALAAWKDSVDGCGNNLLDFTCVPFLTEVGAAGHEHSNMPAMLIGGRKLGFIHDRYVNQRITIGELWGTIAQAFDFRPTELPFEPPVAGFWAKP
jgi:hypothetical protein